jgi:hypothetical protein
MPLRGAERIASRTPRRYMQARLTLIIYSDSYLRIKYSQTKQAVRILGQDHVFFHSLAKNGLRSVICELEGCGNHGRQ